MYVISTGDQHDQIKRHQSGLNKGEQDSRSLTDGAPGIMNETTKRPFELSATKAQTHLGEVHPVCLVQLGPDEEVEVGDQIILSHQSCREPELAVGVAHTEHFPEHSSGDHVHLIFAQPVSNFIKKTSSCAGRGGGGSYRRGGTVMHV